MSIKNFIRETFRSCLDILRDSEYLTGDKALRPLGYFLQLRLLEPQFGKEIDIENYDYCIYQKYASTFSKEECDKHLAALLRLTRFSYLAKVVKEDDLVNNMEFLWNDILAVHPATKDVFLAGRGFQLKKQSTYKKIIDKLALVEFENIDEDILGEVYEEVVKDIMTGKTLGQFFTPPVVKQMMVDLINPQIHPDGTTESIFDPAMGTGGLLITGLRSLMSKSKASGVQIKWDILTKNRTISGRECEPDTFQLAVSNMLISSGKKFQLEQGDSIRNPITTKYDIIIANPPFGIKGLEYDEITSPLRNAYLPIKSKSSTPLFLQAIIYMLKVNGRCAVVLPDGQDLFSKSKSLIAVREYLMKTCDLKEVIYLPPGIFTHTTIKTCVFYFHKRKEGSEAIELKIKRSDTKETDRSYVFTQAHQTEKVIFSEFDGTTKRIIVDVGIAEIAKNNYSLNFAEYLEKPDSAMKIGGGSSNVVKTLGEVCKVDFGTRIVKSNNTEGEYPVFGSGKATFSTTTFNREGYNVLIGRFALSAECVRPINEKIFLNDSGLSIKPIDTRQLLHKYLGHYLHVNQDVIYACARGTAQKNLDMDKFRAIQIPIPSIEKQQEIIDHIERHNESYKHYHRINQEKLQSLKQMNEFCFQTSVVFGATVKTLGEICKFDIGGTPSRSVNDYYQNGTNLWVSVSELNRGYINDSKEKITDTGVQNSSVKLFPKDTVLFSFKLSIGKTAIVGTPLYTNEAIAGIFSKTPESLSNKYLYHYLSNNDFTKLGSGLLGNGSLNKKSLAEIKIPFPSLEQQQQIIEFCEANDILIKQLEKEIEQTEKFEKILIQNAFHGLVSCETFAPADETKKRKHGETK